MKKLFPDKRILFIIFTAFLSMMGIGLIIPVIPFIVQSYMPGASNGDIALHAGMLMSIYSVCQFLAAPGLGALSDKFGRRLILLACLIGSVIGYLIFGIGGSLTILYIGRIIDGITGGDISTIFAYVADITPPQERGKTYGLVGATVGLGFMIGPTIGGLTSMIHLNAPLFLAAGVTFLNFLFGLFILPESLPKKHRMTDFSLHHLNPLTNLTSVLSNVTIRTLLFLGFLYFFPFAQMSSVGGVFTKDILHWTPAMIGYFFLVLGIMDIFAQGYLSRKLIVKYGEVKMIFAGLTIVSIAYLLNAINLYFPYTLFAFFNVLVYALGSGLLEPSLASLISKSVGHKEQGRVAGANTSMQSITRIIGPIIATSLYGVYPNLPYIVCFILTLGAIYYLWINKKLIVAHMHATR